MSRKTTELVFLIDKSGSMRGLEGETIRGINAMLNRLRSSSEGVLVTTVLFADSMEILHDRMPLEAIRPLSQYDYYTQGCTALMDAIGETIGRIQTFQKYAEKTDISDRTLFVITTDGYENASRHFTVNQIRRMIKDLQRESDWEFLFFGATLDVARAAGNIGIARDRTSVFRADSEGVREHYNTLAQILDDYIMQDEASDEVINEPVPLNKQRLGRFADKLKDILGFEPEENFDWEE